MSERRTLFQKFGGIRPMARHVDRPVSTVQSWKSAGRVPADEQPHVLQTARALALDVTADDLVFPMGVPA